MSRAGSAYELGQALREGQCDILLHARAREHVYVDEHMHGYVDSIDA